MMIIMLIIIIIIMLLQEVFDYDQNNTLWKGENNTTRDSERIIYRDKNDNLKILNIRIKDDSNHDS